MEHDFDVEKIVRDLKQIMPFKETTVPGDIVLVVADHLLYAVVGNIERDVAKRDEWWHLTLQLLTVPPKQVVWTLREPQFTGQEIFTMGGEKRFIKAVAFEGWSPHVERPTTSAKKTAKRPVLKVIK
ncbi:MAG TPA: hypothetical protein VLL73_02165 [Desulfurivibrionaceae bacterium]|nr:hypothetical protein [Desulfurivibrionaceae bacterium]